MTISIANKLLPLPVLMRHLGVPPSSIPYVDGQNMSCPWHKDNCPSFGIYQNGARAHCFSCGWDGDGPDFIAKWVSCGRKEAVSLFCKLALVCPSFGGTTVSPRSFTTHVKPDKRVVLCDSVPLTDYQIRQIATNRKIDVRAVDYARKLGVIQGCCLCGHPSWILLDSTQRLVEGRRLDGEWYPAFANLSARKAHTLKGSDKAWPVGVELVKCFPSVQDIMIVEGGPDYLAALHFLFLLGRVNVMPVAMLGKGAGQKGFHPDALSFLANKRIRIYPHHDPDGGGLMAAEAWAATLRQSGCSVDLFQFGGMRRRDGMPIKDLNDLTMLSSEAQHVLSQLIP